MLLLHMLPSPSRLVAYLDPGTGSFITQFLVAGIAGTLFALKGHLRALFAFAGRRARVSSDSDATKR